MTGDTWRKEVDDYIAGLEATGKSKGYIGNTRQALEHIADMSGISIFNELTREQVVAWLADIRKHGMSGKKSMTDTTLKTTLGRLKTFLRHLNDGEAPRCIRGLPRINGSKSRVKSSDELLTDDEVEQLAAHLKQPWKAALLIMRRTGARPGEVLGLRPSDVVGPKTDDTGTRFDLTFRDTKTDQPRTVWLYDRRAIDAVTELLKLVKGQYLFSARNGEPTNYSVFTRFLKRAAKRAGIEKRIYAYLARHTFITEMKRRGVSDDAIMVMTGHATRRMLDNYSHLTQDETRKSLAPHLADDRMPIDRVADIDGEVERRVQARIAEVEARFEKRLREMEKLFIGQHADDDSAPDSDEEPYGDLDDVDEE